MRSEVWRVTPQQIDPLSWFTRPLVPVAFAVLALVVGLGTFSATWQLGRNPWLDLAAIALVVGACLVVQVRTRPLQPAFAVQNALLPLVLALLGLVASTVSNVGGTALVQHWWAPIGVGLVVATLGPYSSVLQVLAYGSVLTVATAVCSLIGFGRADSVWPPLSVAVIAASVVAVGTVATAVFCFAVVSATQRQLAGIAPPPSAVANEDALNDEAVNDNAVNDNAVNDRAANDEAALNDEAARRVERRTLARLGNRVAPFLEQVADAGEVTAADRALAGQLARRLRSDLVSQANRTWLDSVALFGRIVVVDPDGLADRMNSAQRTALRALLIGILDDPAATVGSLFVELRGDDDGSTAVALSLDFSLPEGRRSSMLAPYYVTLQATVESLSWDPSRDLLRFQLPARGPEE